MFDKTFDRMFDRRFDGSSLCLIGLIGGSRECSIGGLIEG